jgi:hypothetical protein
MLHSLNNPTPSPPAWLKMWKTLVLTKIDSNEPSLFEKQSLGTEVILPDLINKE